MRKLRVFCLSLLLFGLAAFGAPRSAGAVSGSGYLCWVNEYLLADPGGMGSHGYISFGLYSASGCTGNFLGYFYMVTEGHGFGAQYIGLDLAGMAGQMRLLQQAEYSTKRVLVSATESWGAPVTSLQFNANP